MTSKEILSTAKSRIRQKMRAVLSADKKAYRKSMNLKVVKNGNRRKRSKGSQATAPAINDSITPA